MAIKLLVCAYENSGKSTMTSTIKDALVINFDRKEYGFKVPHANFKEYEGMDKLLDFISDKLSNYKEKFKSFPKFIVLDTVTQMYSAMAAYNSKKYNGFNIHSQNNTDTLAFNDYIENVLIPNGVSVVIVAHTIVDPDTQRHIIHAQGQFFKAGSWLSVVDNSLFIEKSSGKLIVHLKGFKYPTRTTLNELPEKVNIDEFNINEYLDKLLNSKTNVEEYIL